MSTIQGRLKNALQAKKALEEQLIRAEALIKDLQMECTHTEDDGTDATVYTPMNVSDFASFNQRVCTICEKHISDRITL